MIPSLKGEVFSLIEISNRELSAIPRSVKNNKLPTIQTQSSTVRLLGNWIASILSIERLDIQQFNKHV